MPRIDFAVTQAGLNLMLIEPANDAAFQFAASHIEGAQWFGRSMAVHPNQLLPVLSFLADEGFEVGAYNQLAS